MRLREKTNTTEGKGDSGRKKSKEETTYSHGRGKNKFEEVT